MIIFLCIYLVIGLAICRGATLISGKNIFGDALEHMNKYDVFAVTIIAYSGIMLTWPIILIAANISNEEDK